MSNSQEARNGVDPSLQRLLLRVFGRVVDVETAARHLWVLHRAAGRLRVRRRLRQSVALATVAIVLAGTSGLAVAANRPALPGDVLYPVKRGAEQVQLAVTLGADQDARLRLRFAHRRLAEASRALDRRPQAVAALLTDAIAGAQRAEQAGNHDLNADVALFRDEATATIGLVGSALAPSLTEELLVAVAGIGGASVAAGEPGHGSRPPPAVPGGPAPGADPLPPLASAPGGDEPAPPTPEPRADPAPAGAEREAGAALPDPGAGDTEREPGAGLPQPGRADPEDGAGEGAAAADGRQGGVVADGSQPGGHAGGRRETAAGQPGAGDLAETQPPAEGEDRDGPKELPSFTELSRRLTERDGDGSAEAVTAAPAEQAHEAGEAGEAG